MHIATHGNRWAALFNHDGIAILKLRAGNAAIEQEVVKIDRGDGGVIAHHAHLAVAA